MSSVGITRSTVVAIVEETTAGELLAPTSGSDFLPYISADLSFEAESLDNEEIFNDLGKAKKIIGDETPTGELTGYLKNSGVVATEPDYGLLYESLLGTVTTAAAELDTVSGSTANVVNLDVGEGVLRPVGSAVMIKHASGYDVRNVSAVNTDALTMSFSLDNAPGTGVLIGRPITYSPGTTFPTFSFWKYDSNGHAVEAEAGCVTKELSIEADASGLVGTSFSFEGIKYYFNPIEITATSRFLDFNDGSDRSVTLTEAWYRNPKELATHIETLLNDSASSIVFTVTYSDTTGKFTIAGDGAFSIEFATGANTANTVAPKIGFAVSDSASATSHVSVNAQTLTASYTPSVDNVAPIVFKDSELFIGTQSQNLCKCPTNVSITISKETEKVKCACEETGVKEIISIGREVTLSATIVLDKFEVSTFDQLLNNTSIQASLTIGPKSSRNWIPGKCVNMYLRNCTITKRNITGDNFFIAEIELSGFVTSDSKDFYLNMI